LHTVSAIGQYLCFKANIMKKGDGMFLKVRGGNMLTSMLLCWVLLAHSVSVLAKQKASSQGEGSGVGRHNAHRHAVGNPASACMRSAHLVHAFSSWLWSVFMHCRPHRNVVVLLLLIKMRVRIEY
jgi:hypothetical protein